MMFPHDFHDCITGIPFCDRTEVNCIIVRYLCHIIYNRNLRIIGILQQLCNLIVCRNPVFSGRKSPCAQHRIQRNTKCAAGFRVHLPRCLQNRNRFRGNGHRLPARMVDFPDIACFICDRKGLLQLVYPRLGFCDRRFCIFAVCLEIHIGIHCKNVCGFHCICGFSAGSQKRHQTDTAHDD